MPFSNYSINDKPRFRSVNWIGVKTLYMKETRRFLKVWVQTVAAPIMTSLLLFAMFNLVLERAKADIDGFDFATFVLPGFVTLGLIQNAFANSSSSLFIGKIQKNIVDILMPPLSPGEFLFAYIASATTRGILIAALTYLGLLPFLPAIPMHSPWLVAYFLVSGGILLGLIGVLVGIWAEKFDHVGAITAFVIVPLSFLSGTFYPIERLPTLFQYITRLDPFYYLIDGFRFALIGRIESPPLLGVIVIAALNVALWALCWYVLKKGYRLKT